MKRVQDGAIPEIVAAGPLSTSSAHSWSREGSDRERDCPTKIKANAAQWRKGDSYRKTTETGEEGWELIFTYFLS